MPDSPYEPERWFALQVVPRHEKKVAMLLGCKGCLQFLPTYRSKRKWSDRIKSVEAPLFPGYVFCRIGQSLVKLVLGTPGVRRIVGFAGRPFPVSDGEIDVLQRIVNRGQGIRPAPYLRIGEKVRVKGGPLEGVAGVLIQFKNQQRLVISVDLIMQSISVEVDEWVVGA